MFQRIRDLVADVCRYEETAPINSACMRCILLWSMARDPRWASDSIYTFFIT